MMSLHAYRYYTGYSDTLYDSFFSACQRHDCVERAAYFGHFPDLSEVFVRTCSLQYLCLRVLRGVAIFISS